MHAESNPSNSSRRDFVKASLAVGAGGLVMGQASQATAHESASSVGLVSAGDTVLFQGDSITDARRKRKQAATANKQEPMGNGYAWLAAASMLVDRPEDELTIFNRGMSGHKVFQLDDRWQADCLDIKPDVLSILIGVNDIWHMLNGSYDGTVEVYERDFHALVNRTKEALPNIKLVICEPFVLKCGSVTDTWFPLFDEYRAAAKRVSEAAVARFVPFQAMFDRAIEYAPPEHWAKDGVHPSPAGAALMAHQWLRSVGGDA